MAAEAAALFASVQRSPSPRIGTVCAALASYEESADFATLAPRTQRDYQRVLRRFTASFAGLLLQDVSASFLLELRDRLAQRGYRVANLEMQILRNALHPSVIRGELDGGNDPFVQIERVRRPQSLAEPNIAWRDDEVEAVIEAAIARGNPGLARAVGLARYGGFRRGDICRMPRSARIERLNEDGVLERRISWVTEKRRTLADRREDQRLTELLARTEPRGKIIPTTLAFNSKHAQWQPTALNHTLARLVAALAKRGLCREGLGLHGLRHSRGVELALAGASDSEIQAQLDHGSPHAARIYRRQAHALSLADAAQDRVDSQVIRLRTARENRG
jgi:hypothetical protein